VSQAVVYVNDTSVYPGSVANLRTTGYSNVADLDPWNTSWVATALFQDNTPPADASAELHVCSEGPTLAVADCDSADLTAILPNGALGGGVGYSSSYGSWQGR
jgi:hypothetical protein